MEGRVMEKVVMDELVRSVLSAWGDFSVRFDGRPAQGPAALGFERAVAFSGATQGTLILRCPPGLGRMLAQASGQSDAEACFQELSIQVGRRLLESLGGPDARPALLSDRGPSSVRDWPTGRPRLAMALLVDGLPLELRLWLRAQPEAGPDLHLDSSSRRAAQRVRSRNQREALAYA
jgi:hypothetical protein